MQNTISICRATFGDAERISAVICAAIVEVNLKDYSQATIDRLIDNFSPPKVRSLLKDRVTFVALCDERIVGTGALKDDQVKSVFVAPAHHRKGIGGRLVKAIEDLAREQDLTSLTVSSSLAAVPLYAALGYLEERRQFYGDEETVLMVKLLP